MCECCSIDASSAQEKRVLFSSEHATMLPLSCGLLDTIQWLILTQVLCDIGCNHSQHASILEWCMHRNHNSQYAETQYARHAYAFSFLADIVKTLFTMIVMAMIAMASQSVLQTLGQDQGLVASSQILRNRILQMCCYNYTSYYRLSKPCMPLLLFVDGDTCILSPVRCWYLSEFTLQSMEKSGFSLSDTVDR